MGMHYSLSLFVFTIPSSQWEFREDHIDINLTSCPPYKNECYLLYSKGVREKCIKSNDVGVNIGSGDGKAPVRGYAMTLTDAAL